MAVSVNSEYYLAYIDAQHLPAISRGKYLLFICQLFSQIERKMSDFSFTLEFFLLLSVIFIVSGNTEHSPENEHGDEHDGEAPHAKYTAGMNKQVSNFCIATFLCENGAKVNIFHVYFFIIKFVQIKSLIPIKISIC